MCHYYNFNRNVALANTFGMSLEDSSGRSSTTSVTFGTVPTTTTASVSAVTASTTDGSTGAVVPVGTVPNPAMPVLPPAMPALPEATPTVPQATPALPAVIPPVAAPLVSVEESNLVESVQEGIAAQIQETEDVEELEADDVREEEIRPAVGSGYIYDDETLREILADRHGEQRSIVDGKKLDMIGETVSVTGQIWSVTGDILPQDIGIEFPEEDLEDFAEVGIRCNTALPRRFRTNHEIHAGNRSSPRNTPLKRVDLGEEETIHNFFLTLFPVNWKESLKLLNIGVTQHNETVRSKQFKINSISQNEYWIFNGLLCYCGLVKSGGVGGLYKKQSGIIQNAKGAEYMSHKRFKQLKQVWVSQFNDASQKQTNAWWKVAKLVTGFNSNRAKTVASSRVKTLDESMSAFRPQKTKTGNLPNISYILRKPKNLGTELKTVATKGANGAMIHAEIQEGKTYMKDKKYFRPYGATAACVLRLAEATKNCGQRENTNITNLFYGDSWFAGLKTAVAVKELHNSEFIGIVKTSHKQFPKAYIEKEMNDWPPGTHLVLKTTVNTNTYYAIGYKYSCKKIICFITSGSAGHTLPGQPYEAKWMDANGRVQFRDIPRPHLISEFFLHSNQIDKHNHARQSELAIEENVVTFDGYFRLYCTYLGITITDTWKLYRHHLGLKHKNKTMSISNFANILCKTLLVNDYKATGYETTTIPPLPPLQDPSSRQSLTFPDHITQFSQDSTVSSLASTNSSYLIKIGEGKYVSSNFKPMHSTANAVKDDRKVRAGKGSAGETRTKRGRCRECGNSAGYTCSVCDFCLCQPWHKSERTCFRDHVNKCVAKERIEHWHSLQGIVDI